jgi:hypothetical protein
MTGALDTRARATAEAMIAKFGKAMTLRRATVGTYDTATATSPVVPTSYAVVGVVSQPSDANIQAGLAQAGDLQVLLAAKPLTVVPQPGDVLLSGVVTWQMLSVRSIYSGELIALYNVLARS